MNEWNEGLEWADDPSISSQHDKLMMSALLQRTEEKKMPLLPGVDMSKPHGPRYIPKEFPKMMYHRKFAPKTIQTAEERTALIKEGWMDTPAKLTQEQKLLDRIASLEEELASSIVEYQKLTGKDYGNELAKLKKAEKGK